jgi:glycosyltransferase involved in cell wall biosynthesis
MRAVVQIAPEIAAGSGVGGVAHHLERALQSAGVTTERFTMTEAAGGWLPVPGRGVRGKLILMARVVWFSTVGTVLARRFLADRPGAVSVCHNDVLAGEIYVNHGILKAAMQARGHYRLRMLRNPLHLFTALRDRLRYRLRVHRVVVSLTGGERELLQHSYPRLRPRAVVIGNGVDIDRFRPSTAAERAEARAAVDPANPPPEDAVVVLFVGHEFDRKGLPLVIDALTGAPPELRLVVVGGTDDMVAGARTLARQHGVEEKVHLVGQMVDPLPAFRAADLFILPSAYEANALVILEALACGLPVIATPVGYVPELIKNGSNGYLVERNARSVRQRLEEACHADRHQLAANARATALPHAWPVIADKYLALFDELTEGGDDASVRTGLRR